MIRSLPLFGTADESTKLWLVERIIWQATSTEREGLILPTAARVYAYTTDDIKDVLQDAVHVGVASYSAQVDPHVE